MFETLLVATDGSIASEKAVAWAVELAKRHDSRLIVLNVTPDSFSDGGRHDAPEALILGIAGLGVAPVHHAADAFHVGGDEHLHERASGSGCAPRTTWPGVAPVHWPSTNVMAPDFTVQR